MEVFSISKTIRYCLAGGVSEEDEPIDPTQAVIEWLQVAPSTRGPALSRLLASQIRTAPDPSNADIFCVQIANSTIISTSSSDDLTQTTRDPVLDAVRLILSWDDSELQYPSIAKRWAVSLLVELGEETQIERHDVAKSVVLREGITFPPRPPITPPTLTTMSERLQHEHALETLFRNAQTAQNNITSMNTKAEFLTSNFMSSVGQTLQTCVDPTFLNSPRGLALVRAYAVLDPPTMGPLVLELFNKSILSFTSLQASEFPSSLRRVLSAGRLTNIYTLHQLAKLIELKQHEELEQDAKVLFLDLQESLGNVEEAVLVVVNEVNEQDPEHGIGALITVMFHTIRDDMPACCVDLFYTAWCGMLKCVLLSEFVSAKLKKLARSCAMALTKKRVWWLDGTGNVRDEMMLANFVVESLGNLVVDTVDNR